MRWWLNTDSPRLFSVDNASVKGMDFSALDPDIWMVQWTEGTGEIERQDDKGANLNGLREQFIDITPYAPLFQQFLTLLQQQGLTLDQAKKVQIDLINQVFESKRQAPFHYPIAVGDYWWDATDATMGASTNAALQNTIAKVNEIASRLNSLVTALLNGQLIAQVNSRVTTKANSNDQQLRTDAQNAIVAYNVVVSSLAVLISHINGQIVTPANAAFGDYNAFVVDVGNALIGHINTTMLGNFEGTPDAGPNSINNRLRAADRGGSVTAAPGLSGNIAAFGSGFAHTGNFLSALGDAFAGASGMNALTGIQSIDNLAWTAIANVPTSSQQWIPIGATAPVNVTPAEQAAIMSGIAARTNDLNVKRNTKVVQVNALTTIAAVIAYDVTTGW